jgi:eukaryotic-like serine/threonine-protein kinase
VAEAPEGEEGGLGLQLENSGMAGAIEVKLPEMAAAPQPDDVAAHRLLGLNLEDGWTVVEKVEKSVDATGSNFSVGYIVEKDGSRAFLKALDYSSAFESDDFARVIERMTQEFNFERDILRRCAEGRMDRVVLALGNGQITVPNAPAPAQVSYLIFELADGDIRKMLADPLVADDDRWKLRMLHNAATGLAQMHRRGMAHQDVKPSNVLVFADDSAKIGDLGRASQRNFDSPFDHLAFPGQLSYRPLEFFYGHISQDWNQRRQAADLYMLGSLVVFLFGGGHMSTEVFSKIMPVAHWSQWGGRPYRDALPYLVDAFDEVIDELEVELAPELKSPLTTMVRRLCDPDPDRRGHPLARAMKHGNPYSLERFISEFDSLARRAVLRQRP